MPMNAAVTRSTASRSPEVIIAPSARGTICQETPKRSLSQPHASAPGTAESAAQSRSISAWSSQSTISDTASLKLKACGVGAVHRHQRLPVDADLRVHNRAGGVLAAAIVAQNPFDPRRGEDRGVELDRGLGPPGRLAARRAAPA